MAWARPARCAEGVGSVTAGAHFAPEEIHQSLRVKAARIKLAREGAAAFCEYVLRDERTGKPIQNAPLHDEWHHNLDRNKRSIIWSAVEQGKTSQIAVGRTLFKLGKDPTRRIVVLGNTQGQASKITRTVQGYIERSAELYDVFPHLRPGTPWGVERFNVVRNVFSKDFSVQATGARGKIYGGRIDDLLVDDILDIENTRDVEQMNAMIAWWKSTIVGRLTADSSVEILGNAFHPKDLLHHLAEESGYDSRKYPVLDDTGAIRFPQNWTHARIAQKREELGPVEAARQLDCVDRDEGSQRCKSEWITRCLERGRHVQLVNAMPLELLPLGCVCFTGCDIGVGKKKKSGRSACFTIMIHPNGDRQVLWVTAGRWSAVELTTQITDHQRFFGSLVNVEDNGVQKHIIELVQKDPANADIAEFILCFNTGSNKTHPVFGVEGVFAEFAGGKWIIPSVERNGKLVGASQAVIEWLAECEAYSPTTHTGDLLMAAWFAKEGGRTRFPVEVGAKVLGDEPKKTTPEAAAEHAAELDGWEAVLKKKR